MTQRNRRDKRHSLALAPISEAPRPLTSLRRPQRTPLFPPGQSFPWPGSDPRSGPGPVSRRPRPRLGDLALLHPRPFPSLPLSFPCHRPLSPGRTGVQGPRRRAPLLPARRGVRARARASRVARPTRLAPSIAPLARSPTRLLGPAEGSGLSRARSAPWRSEGCKPRPAPSPPAASRRVPRSPLGGLCRARPRVLEAEQLPPPAGPAAAQGWQLSFLFWNMRDGLREMLTQNAG